MVNRLSGLIDCIGRTWDCISRPFASKSNVKPGFATKLSIKNSCESAQLVLVQQMMRVLLYPATLRSAISNSVTKHMHNQYVYTRTVFSIHPCMHACRHADMHACPVSCCESRMAERTDWWTERWLKLCFWSGCNGCSGHLTHNCWM